MKIVDANVLLYAVDDQSIHHERVRNWWQSAVTGDEQIGLAWPTLVAFLRLSTRPGIFRQPLSLDLAISLIDEWLAQPNVKIVAESSEHWEHLKSMLSEIGAAGNLTNDAHLAAVALATGATIVSCDSDFNRFRTIRIENPLTIS